MQATSVDWLYRRLLGDAWAMLDQSVRELHPPVQTFRGAGRFNVRRGQSLFARLLSMALRLPAPGEDVPVRLRVTRTADGETWHREFAGRPFVTSQRAEAGRWLVEEFGPASVRFQLSVSEGALVYRQVRFALRLGPLSVPIPGPLFPRIEARETATASAVSDGSGAVLVSVRVSHSLTGLLVAYEGRIEREV